VPGGFSIHIALDRFERKGYDEAGGIETTKEV
jgi:hypothetical protein